MYNAFLKFAILFYYFMLCAFFYVAFVFFCLSILFNFILWDVKHFESVSCMKSALPCLSCVTYFTLNWKKERNGGLLLTTSRGSCVILSSVRSLCVSSQFNYMHECFERVFCELKWRREVRTCHSFQTVWIGGRCPGSTITSPLFTGGGGGDRQRQQELQQRWYVWRGKALPASLRVRVRVRVCVCVCVCVNHWSHIRGVFHERRFNKHIVHAEL